MRDYMATHHLFWPARWYRTRLERDFRDLCCNKVELAMSVHVVLHRYQREPDVPSRGDMLHCILVHMDTCLHCNAKFRRRYRRE